MTITGQPSFARWQQSRDITPWTVVHGSTTNELIATIHIHTSFQPIIDALRGLAKAVADIIDEFNAVFGQNRALMAAVASQVLHHPDSPVVDSPQPDAAPDHR